MKKYFFYSLISGLFFFISWPPNLSFLVFFIFFSFIPLFLIERDLNRKNKSIFWILPFSYFTFFIFNFSTTFWVEKSEPAIIGEGLFAVLCNSLFMATTFLLYCIFCKYIVKYFSNYFRVKFLRLFVFSAFWIGFELLHMNWDLNWPWLTLGNVFSDNPMLIQWYSYTGVLGGTVWILILNYVFFQTYLNFPYKNRLTLKDHLILVILFFLPFSFSVVMYYNFYDEGDGINVLVTQPNIDPHDLQVFDPAYIYDLINDNLNDSIDYVIFPESFFPHESYYKYLTTPFFKKHKNTNFIFGAQVKRGIEKYNSAIQLHFDELNGENLQYHYKSKLVPGPELTPFSSSLKPLLDFTGLSLQLGGLTKGSSANVFYSADSLYCVAPIICYESIFPSYVRSFVKKGAQVIFIITNDGWWGDSKGRVQHNSYARIRSIETRRYVVRSANTGISSVIDPKGNFLYKMEHNMKGSFVQKIPFLNDKTFYVKYGNILIFFYLASFIFLIPKIRFKQTKIKNI